MTEFYSLFIAWYRTRYRVHLPDGDVDFVLGAVDERIDRQLAALGIDRWTMLTGWNPNSEVCSDDENERANAALAGELTERGLRFFPSEGVPETDDWVPEQGFFVANVSERDAFQLGESYGQMAVLYGVRGSHPWLLFPEFPRYRARIAAVAEDEGVDDVIRRVARQTLEGNELLE